MKRLVRIVLAAAALSLMAPAPAHATLLVRSDGAGFQLEDKNNLRDRVDITTTTRNGQPAYRVHNKNAGDVFKFDRQAGCHATSDGAVVVCERRPTMIIRLLDGNDSLSMFSAPAGSATVIAGAGEDFVQAQAGPDRIEGGTGADELFGNEGNDLIFGQEHGDTVFGEEGNDELRGEGAGDFIVGGLGADVIRGGSGNDNIATREGTTPGIRDTVDCGTGTDTVDADLQDELQSDCNNVTRSPVGETPHVRIRGTSLRVSPSGRVRVRLRCPRGVRSLGCRGRLQMRLDTRTARRSRSRRVRYRIRAGRGKTVTLRLTRRDVRTLSRRQRRGRRTRGIVTSVERGRLGRKTTVRNPRLRLRRG